MDATTESALRSFLECLRVTEHPEFGPSHLAPARQLSTFPTVETPVAILETHPAQESPSSELPTKGLHGDPS
jgi:hypothetical protein